MMAVNGEIAEMEKLKPVSKIKLNREQIREGLKQVPLESIIMGEGKKRSLTAKQKGFIKDVALGKPKAQAYRDNYNTKANPRTVGNNAYNLASNTVIASEIEAFRMAMEAQAYHESGQMKAFIIHQLTQHALNPDTPPASRIRSLELLGKTYDVGLFVDRKEVTTVNTSHDAKTKLMEQLKRALNRNSITVDYEMTGESLLAELATPLETADMDTHVTPIPLNGLADDGSDTHSIPNNQLAEKNQSSENSVEDNNG